MIAVGPRKHWLAAISAHGQKAGLFPNAYHLLRNLGFEKRANPVCQGRGGRDMEHFLPIAYPAKTYAASGQNRQPDHLRNMGIFCGVGF